jgi:hypothetical protein
MTASSNEAHGAVATLYGAGATLPCAALARGGGVEDVESEWSARVRDGTCHLSLSRSLVTGPKVESGCDGGALLRERWAREVPVDSGGSMAGQSETPRR